MSFSLVSLKGSFLLIPICIIVSLILAFIDSKITNKEYDSTIYIKIGLLVLLVSAFMLYVNSLKYISTEEIITTPPPF
jgi:hypothetical protein